MYIFKSFDGQAQWRTELLEAVSAFLEHEEAIFLTIEISLSS